MNFLNKDQDMLKTYVNDILNKVANIIKKELDCGSIYIKGNFLMMLHIFAVIGNT